MGWSSVGKILEETGIPCYIENDANAIALGETWMGAGRGYGHVCCLTLGTGVGGGVIIDGQLLRGADGMAAELGHIAVESNGARCNCGSNGCLETFASATGMLRMLSEALPQTKTTSLSGIPVEQITPAVIYQHAERGDPLSLKILQDAGRGLGSGLASLINTFNPEIIIIGGGVAAAWDILMPPALEVMHQRLQRRQNVQRSALKK
jgi:glucokinase